MRIPHQPSSSAKEASPLQIFNFLMTPRRKPFIDRPQFGELIRRGNRTESKFMSLVGIH